MVDVDESAVTNMSEEPKKDSHHDIVIDDVGKYVNTSTNDMMVNLDVNESVVANVSDDAQEQKEDAVDHEGKYDNIFAKPHDYDKEIKSFLDDKIINEERNNEVVIDDNDTKMTQDVQDHRNKESHDVVVIDAGNNDKTTTKKTTKITWAMKYMMKRNKGIVTNNKNQFNTIETTSTSTDVNANQMISRVVTDKNTSKQSATISTTVMNATNDIVSLLDVDDESTANMPDEENTIVATSLEDMESDNNVVVDDIHEERHKGDIDDNNDHSKEQFNTNEQINAASTTTGAMNSHEISHTWTRNFSTPLLALVDLLDNALDATTLTNRGRIYIEPDLCIGKVATTTRFIPEQTTGLLLWNTSNTLIKPLYQVINGLNDYGMGLKHGCLSLSNLSFCLVKSKQYRLGVIRQKTEFGSPTILDFTFNSSTMDDLKKEIFHTFTKTENHLVNECIVHYGVMMSGHKTSIPDGGIGALYILGIDRLIEKYQKMNQENFPHICCTIIDHIKHNDDVSQEICINKLLETLYEDLPKRYLHIPSISLLDIRVNGHIVNFNYWQRRLVEMSQFHLKIHKSAKMTDIFNALAAAATKKKKSPQKNDIIEDDDEKSNNDKDVPTEKGSSKIFIDSDPSQVYTLRIYIGFDALRVFDAREENTAAMYIYSGQSGRLIKSNLDCRKELKLSERHSEYCQGLTLIVDDYHGKFPLILTKEDLGFHGEQHGETHKQNLNMWLSAAVRMYYTYYRDHIFNAQKNVLIETLRTLEPKAQQLIQRSSTSFKSLSNCIFTSFGVFTSSSLTNNDMYIRLLPLKSIKCHTGRDTILRLPVGDYEEVGNKDQQPTKNSGKKSKNNIDETSRKKQSKKNPPPISDNQVDKDRPKTTEKKSKNNVEKSRRNQSNNKKPPPHDHISISSDNDSDSETYIVEDEDMDDDLSEPRDNSQTKRHKEMSSLSETLLLESNKKSIENLLKKLAMEDENRQLIQKLAKETSALLAEVSKQNIINKKLQLQVKQIEKKKKNNTKSQYSDEEDDDERSLSSAENNANSKTKKRITRSSSKNQEKKNNRSRYLKDDDDETSLSTSEDNANSKKRKRITRSSSKNQEKKSNRSPYLDDDDNDDDEISLSSSENSNSKKRKRITARSSKTQAELKFKSPMSIAKISGKETSTPDKLRQVEPKRRNATKNKTEYITGMYKQLNSAKRAKVRHLNHKFMVETDPPFFRTKWTKKAQKEQMEQPTIKPRSLDKREGRKRKRDEEIVSYIKHDCPLMYDKTKETVLARSHALSEYLELDQFRADVKDMDEGTFAIFQESLWKHIKAMICVSQKGWLLDVTHHANNVVPFTKVREWVYDLHFTRWKNDDVDDHKFPLVEWLKVHESTKVKGKLGVFARRRFVKGEVIAIFGGHHIIDPDDSDISRYAIESKDYGICDPLRGPGDGGSDAPFMAMQHVIEVNNTSEVNAKMLSNFLVEATQNIEIDEEILFNRNQSSIKRVVSGPPIHNKKKKNFLY